MKLRHLAFLLPLVLAGCAMTTTAAAACAAPNITISASTVARGAELVVEADNLVASCSDTGQAPAGPATDVPIVLDYAGGESLTLTTIDASPDGTISESVHVPADAPTGAAALRVGEAYSVPVTITD